MGVLGEFPNDEPGQGNQGERAESTQMGRLAVGIKFAFQPNDWTHSTGRQKANDKGSKGGVEKVWNVQLPTVFPLNMQNFGLTY